MPGFVTTKLSKLRRVSWLIPNPQTFVRSAVAVLGVTSRTAGYLAHDLQVCHVCRYCNSLCYSSSLRTLTSEDYFKPYNVSCAWCIAAHFLLAVPSVMS